MSQSNGSGSGGLQPVSIGVTAYDPRAIVSPANQVLVGCIGLFWLPVEWLQSDLPAGGGTITTDLQLALGAAWLPLRVTPNTIKLSEPPRSGRHGTTYTTKVSAQRAALDGVELSGLQVMQGRRCVVMLQEADGRLRLVGTREQPLLCTAGAEVSSPASRAGYDFTFQAELGAPSRYYSGQLPVADGTTITPPAAGGEVRVYNRRGQLMATVPAGRNLVITSGFKVVLSVQ